MNNDDPRRPRLGARLGGYLLLALFALLLALGWRYATASQAADGDAATAPQLAASAAEAPAGDDVSGQALDVAELPAVADLPILQEGGISPAAVPHTFVGKLPQHEFQTYRVVRGDTPNGIADKFGIQATTLLGGNPNLSQESSLLQTGTDLVILPVDGVLHDVQPGDTLESISAQYGIPVETIIGYAPNNLEFPYRLYQGTQILVPGAVREVFVWNPPTLQSVRRTSPGGGIAPLVVGTGTYIFPVNSRNYTQHYWYGHPGLDIGLGEGSTVVASDTGTVTFAGWNIYGYGNLIVINHGNGFETLYAHLSSINVVPGQVVNQGSVIGATGNTGNSSGPHIHFEVRANGNQDDPCYYIGC